MSKEVSFDEEEGLELSILEHLNELRIRGSRAAIGLVAATIFSFIFAEPLLEFLTQPYSLASGDKVIELQTLRPTENIETFFKVSLLSGAILSMPIILYQLWMFIAPGLTRNERKYIYIFLPSAVILFGLGITFAWFILIPAAIDFLFNFLSDVFMPEWTSDDYLSFVTSMIFWLGISFEMPVIVYFIARAGVISAQVLREQWRFAVVGIAVLAAIITPSIDPITMLLTMLPLLILYLLSMVLARIGQRQFEKSMAI